MPWSTFYLICFLVGFGMSALSLLSGSVHLHIPHLHFDHGIHLGHMHGHGGGQNVASWFNLGTKTVSNEIIFTQGSFQTTGNPLDLVIQGNGFFQIHLSSGETAYTRAGQFQLDNNGNIVDSSGNMLEPQIAIPSGAQTITIATDGTVSVTLPNQTAAQVVGQIQQI